MAKRFQPSHDRCSLLHSQTSERVGERRLADEGVAVILRDRASTAEIAPFTPHDMRRTYISELLDAGADPATVQKMVGHASVTTTAGYDRRGDAAKRQAADRVHVPFFPRQQD